MSDDVRYLIPEGITFEGRIATFNTVAMTQAVEGAKYRSEGSRKVGLVDQRRAPGKYSNFDLDLIGIQGEMVVGAYLDLPVRIAQGKDMGHDFTLPNGMTVDAKASFSDDAPLRFAKPCRADFAMFVVRHDPDDLGVMRVVGWCEKVLGHETGLSKPFTKQQSQLNAPETLFRAVVSNA